jgi:hypothetical protein
VSHRLSLDKGKKTGSFFFSMIHAAFHCGFGIIQERSAAVNLWTENMIPIHQNNKV